MSYFSARFGAAGTSAPTTLAEQLDAFGVTWYGGFRRGLNQFAVSTDQNTPATTLGASVGQWAANWSAGGFSAKFVQSTNSKRPSYMSAFGTTGIRGDATTTWMQLDSTTALNRDHTVLLATTMPITASARTYSQNTNRMAVVSASAIGTYPSIYADNLSGQPVSPVMEITAYDATASRFRIGWRSIGSAFFNFVPNLFRNSNATAYSEAVITEVWLVGTHLTNNQICQCLPFLVQ